MDTHRRWVGWLAIGLGALALLVALNGWADRSAMAASGRFAGPQMYAQPGMGAQGMQPGVGAQPGVGVQGMQPGVGPVGSAPQRGPAAADGFGRSAGGRRGNLDGGMRGWFGFPFRLGVAPLGLLALLIGLGVWLVRGRRPVNAAPPRPAAAQPSPTGESYRDELATGESYVDQPDDQV